VGLAVGAAEVEARAVHLVLEQLLASALGSVLPDIGAHVARTGQGTADGALFEGGTSCPASLARRANREPAGPQPTTTKSCMCERSRRRPKYLLRRGASRPRYPIETAGSERRLSRPRPGRWAPVAGTRSATRGAQVPAPAVVAVVEPLVRQREKARSVGIEDGAGHLFRPRQPVHRPFPVSSIGPPVDVGRRRGRERRRRRWPRRRPLRRGRRGPLPVPRRSGVPGRPAGNATNRRRRSIQRSRRQRRCRRGPARRGGSAACGCPAGRPADGPARSRRRRRSGRSRRPRWRRRAGPGRQGRPEIHRTWWVSGRGGNDQRSAEGRSASPGRSAQESPPSVER